MRRSQTASPGALVQKPRSLWWDLVLLAGLIGAFLLVKLPAEHVQAATVTVSDGLR